MQWDYDAQAYLSTEASRSFKPDRTDDRVPDREFAFEACVRRSSWCAITCEYMSLVQERY